MLRAAAARVARGEGVIQRGPAAGLLIDATGRAAGYVLGTSEPEEQRWLAEHVSAGDVGYDIGANIGFHTLVLANLVGSRGRVFSFEPLPANAAQLRRNVALNGLGNVVVVEAAVSSVDGVVPFDASGADRERGRIVESAAMTVESLSLDLWIARTGVPAPNAMKIDVEGAELDVLAGARETIRRSLPALLVEVHWIGLPFVEYVERELAPLGYIARTLGGGPLSREPARFHASLTLQ